MAVALIVFLSGGFLLTVILLIKELSSGDKKTIEQISEIAETGISKFTRTARTGQNFVSTVEEALKGTQILMSKVDLPPDVVARNEKAIAQLRKYSKKVEELLFHEDLVMLLSKVSPISAKIFNKYDPSYTYIVTEDNNQPFQVNQKIIDKAKEIVEGNVLEFEKAKAIFDWFISNITYGKTGWYIRNKRYRHAIEVFLDREGVCGEMAVLYVSMSRAVGLRSRYVSVDVDFQGQSVCHACAAVKINGQYILVDPAYYSFDINHLDYEILTDQEAVPHFKLMRGE